MNPAEIRTVSALSRKWVVLECGETLELRHIGCGGGGSTNYLKKQDLLEATWNPTNEFWALKSGQILHVGGMPTYVKDEIERIRVSGTIDKKAAELEAALRRQTPSDRILSGYVFFSLAVTLAVMFWGMLNLRQVLGMFLGGLLAIVPLIVMTVLAPRFRKRFAPWSGFLAFEDVLFIRIKRAIDELDRFMADGKSVFLDEGVKLLLHVPTVSREPPRRPISGVVQQAEKQVEALTTNITGNIAFHVRRSKDPKTFNRLTLERLRGLLPILAKPDITALASWNEAVRKEFPIPESPGAPTETRKEGMKPETTGVPAFLSRVGPLRMVTFGGLLLAGYIISALILFTSQSLLYGHVLQASELPALFTNLFSTYLLMSTSVAILLAAVWLRK